MMPMQREVMLSRGPKTPAHFINYVVTFMIIVAVLRLISIGLLSRLRF
jgi:hypothetical protein